MLSVEVQASLTLDSDDVIRVGEYMTQHGMTRSQALTQVAQDRLGPAGAEVYLAEEL